MVRPTQFRVELERDVGLVLHVVLTELIPMHADGVHVQLEVAEAFDAVIDVLVSAREKNKHKLNTRATPEGGPDHVDSVRPTPIVPILRW